MRLYDTVVKIQERMVRIKAQGYMRFRIVNMYIHSLDIRSYAIIDITTIYVTPKRNSSNRISIPKNDFGHINGALFYRRIHIHTYSCMMYAFLCPVTIFLFSIILINSTPVKLAWMLGNIKRMLICQMWCRIPMAIYLI